MDQNSRDITKTADEIIQHLGGKENILEFENCITRLRFRLKDQEKKEEDALKRAGVLAIYHSGEEIQLVVGSVIFSFSIAEEIQKRIDNPQK